MGFDINGIRLLINAKQLNINFEKVITIGRQGMDVSEESFHELLTKSNLKKIKFDKYFEPFLELLGAKTTHSLDASQYEGATLIHDMNLPLPVMHKGKYTLVIDGGSLEHIFNFPVAIKNCMDLIEKKGYYIGITPTNNFLGHGFYQFSPEVYYRVFSESNGFKVIKMYFYIDQKDGKTPVFEILDPNSVRQRITMQNSYPSYLFVIAQKVEEKEIFKETPQQSDYENIVWKGLSHGNTAPKVKSINSIKRLIPAAFKRKIYQFKSRIQRRYKLVFQPTGISSPEFIKETEEKIANTR
jgi:hypothetical protein